MVTDYDLMVMLINRLQGQHHWAGSAVIINAEKDKLPNGLFSIRNMFQ